MPENAGRQPYLLFYLDYKAAIAPAMLGKVWRKLAEDKLAEALFHDGTVRDGADFRREMLRPGCLPFLVFAEGKPAMFTWLNNLENKAARAHFAVFREFQGRKKRIPLGKYTYRHILSLRDREGYLFDALYGLTPKTHVLALKAVLACGWERVGEIPGACVVDGQTVPGVLSYATRELLG